ncbi:hypothetical protein PTSG_12974 [Salpingoeca rosetta]|uniref:Uncharacterized protein n=1 Tax=Salpingoeca rosetta (strain ATCC 50818 / BSB-021) TaxID=946362 RepID=F2UP77_SALR5|nr:uncharacterized protein PTSG_12974 [Salpingoeca rosetta]EGD79432.1 hypothetical protein PTSG_12974 [Salpingoeca rosetta]|eukprot:XP_004988913.1 hypothetical protein PTSG_12974 [Salpingoeca rosetta]
MSRITDINWQLLAAGVSIPEDDLRTFFDVAMRFMEREGPAAIAVQDDGGTSSRRSAACIVPRSARLCSPSVGQALAPSLHRRCTLARRPPTRAVDHAVVVWAISVFGG